MEHVLKFANLVMVPERLKRMLVVCYGILALSLVVYAFAPAGATWIITAGAIPGLVYFLVGYQLWVIQQGPALLEKLQAMGFGL